MDARDDPPDRCPYPRPFPPGFSDCPAYQRADFVALTTHYEPLVPVSTCGNLESVPLPTYGRYYPRCRLGDAAQRQAWVDRVNADRVARALSLQSEMADAFRDDVMLLWGLKGDQVRSAGNAEEHERATAALRHALARYLTDLEAFFEEHSADLDALGAPLPLCVELFSRVAEAWLAMPVAGIPELPSDVVDRFPVAARILIDPQRVDTDPSRPASDESRSA